jgi:hypothetical protein
VGDRKFAPQEHSYDFPCHYLTGLEGKSGIRITGTHLAAVARHHDKSAL